MSEQHWDRVLELDPHSVGVRVEGLLVEVEKAGGPAARDAADGVVRELLHLNEAGLARLLDGLVTVPGVTEELRVLAEDELVGGLLALYGLHPVPIEERVLVALDRARRRLGREFTLIDVDAAGTARIALAPGCGGGAEAVSETVCSLVQQAAPEIVEVVVEEAAPEPPLLQIGLPSVSAPTGVHA
ncbi:hypothetical protein CS0771_67100 [Catellatospora sp. IY07-71]|uniref:hypothetical protein n=1 Tax=Catellatospora sp. IY07-71 TaxID=2728827 RepID=UPI001BB31068|nr:hypothetical protein [Catellatospora sp. IY07-71]BCJ77166.1 hypothetical protein CS0771_67100 [Catellatospora sp. IY07-71]